MVSLYNILQNWGEMKETQPAESRRPDNPLKYIVAERKATARRLGLENSPSRWRSGHDGWFFGTKCIERKSSVTQRMKLQEIRNWPIKISTLRPDRQLIAYQTLLKTARLDQVAAYYSLHCEQLEKVRYYIAYELIMHRENDRHFRQVFPVFFSRQDDLAKSSKLKKATHAVQVADKHYRLRAANRAYARGLEALIEKCEVRLQKSEGFTPADWRSYSERPRWADGRKGWTGLRPEEVDLQFVDTAKGEEVGFKELKGERLRAALEARYARLFPRAADRRLATQASEDRGDGKVIRPHGTEEAKVMF
ncbi:MAG: hypothetical protein ASARMPREDX12_005054 [Alectoria sarmentosa]|nr:MAG: hypothetical protein ASARMPREDX12_005054 [Alectoria sarmentosa]